MNQTPTTTTPATPTVPAIYPAMAAIMKEIQGIPKNRLNQKQGYNFRGIEDFYNTIHDVMAKHDVFNLVRVVHQESQQLQTHAGNAIILRVITYKFIFVCGKDGSSVETEAVGEAMDVADKAANKCQSEAHKYALAAVFLVPFEGIEDSDRDTPGPVEPSLETKPQVVHYPEPVYTASAQQINAILNMFQKVRGPVNGDLKASVNQMTKEKFNTDLDHLTRDQASALIRELGQAWMSKQKASR